MGDGTVTSGVGGADRRTNIGTGSSLLAGVAGGLAHTVPAAAEDGAGAPAGPVGAGAGVADGDPSVDGIPPGDVMLGDIQFSALEPRMDRMLRRGSVCAADSCSWPDTPVAPTTVANDDDADNSC